VLRTLASGYPLHHPRPHFVSLHAVAGGSATIPLANAPPSAARVSRFALEKLNSQKTPCLTTYYLLLTTYYLLLTTYYQKIMRFTLLLASYFLFLAACATDSRLNINGKKRTHIHLLSQAQAAKAICLDTTDRFFELIQPLEMSIQLQLSDEENIIFLASPRAEQILEYQDFIRKDAQDFSSEEQKLIDPIMQRALQLSYQIFPNLPLPDTIQLLKTKSKYYGESVYFTRENLIVIPAPQLYAGNEEKLLQVLIHEIFHVYSRRNPAARRALFARIGFTPIDSLQLSPFLAARILYNPDAVDCRYAITLHHGDSTILAVPIIYSRYAKYNPQATFFDHLHFQLFPIQAIDNQTNSYRIAVENTGIDPQDAPDFFTQIGKNTNYIIHPEEIIADNFKLLILEQIRPQMPKDTTLLRDIKNIIQAN
jgi:hypothetical protein